MSVFIPRGTGREYMSPTCSHGFSFVREPKRWGTVYRPNTNACAECAHVEALREVEADRDAEAFFARACTKESHGPRIEGKSRG